MNNKVVGFSSVNEKELMNVDGGFFISGATLGTIAACCAIVTFCYGA